MKYPYNLAICAILRNEGKFVKEWIDWHLMIGVEKFYLYDNESDDNMVDVLRPYIEKGIVDYTYYPGRCRQLPAYNDCLRKHCYDTEWLAVIDGDEFLCPLGGKNLLDFLRQMSVQCQNMGGLGVNWRVFGSNGHIQSPIGGVIENYTRRAMDGYSMGNRHIKSIVNPRRARCFMNPHWAIYYSGYIAVDEEGVPTQCYLAQAGIGQLKHVFLAHYVLKSYEDWLRRRKMGAADSTLIQDTSRAAFASGDRELNTVCDESLLRLKVSRLTAKKKRGEKQKITLGLLEQYVLQQIEDYEHLKVEDILSLYFLVEKTEEESITMSKQEVRILLCGLLHLYFSYRQTISIADYTMVDDAFRFTRNEYTETLKRDLARLRPSIRKYLLLHGNLFDLYLDRLIESNKPGYKPRIAFVEPNLQSTEKIREILWIVRILQQEMKIEIFIYTTAEIEIPELSNIGVRVLTDEQLLSKQLNETNWYGGVDLVILNSLSCYRLLKSHDCPTKRPILWWIHEDIGLYIEINWQEEIAGLKKHDVSTWFSNEKAMCAWGSVGADWNVHGIMPLPMGPDDKKFTDIFKPLTKGLIDIGVHTRYPMEEIGL